MDSLSERLDLRLREWNLDIAAEVRRRVAEIIDWADENAPDVAHSRAVEQEVLDVLDEPASR